MKKPILLLHYFILTFSASIHAQENIETYKSIFKTCNIHLNTSFLIVNDMSWNRMNENNDEPGLWGITTGINYCYTDSRFISIQIGIANHTPYGEVIGADSDGWRKTYRGSSQFISFRNNYVIRRFDLGYGISLSQLKYSFEHSNYTKGLNQSGSFTSLGVGGSFSAYCRMATVFYLGILYQPQLFSLTEGPAWGYRHVISLEAVFRANIGKTRIVRKQPIKAFAAKH